MKASINIQLVKIGLVISVDWEYDHITPTTNAYTVTQVGYNTVLVMYKTNAYFLSINVHVNNDA